MLPKDFKEFLELLISNKVKYLIIGGYAVSFYGYPRYTGDIDIWVKNSRQNISKILKTISDFGFSTLDISENDFFNPRTIVQLGFPPVRIDLMTDIDGVDFDECYKTKNTVFIDDMLVNVINQDDLIKNKKSTGRHIDLNDIEHL